MDSSFSNTKIKDSSAKLIFEDAALCAQFLRGYVDIPLLRDVQPEDIEDVTERYVHMFAEERNSDIVKKVRIQGENKEGDKIPFYLISLIEHKSKVDYNVVMQVIRYMVFIWEDYEREMEKRQKGVSRTKAFRYPPILPIVFYDGSKNWTAAAHLHERVMLSDILGEYIPEYRYMLVQLKDYSNARLMEKRDELSLVMMIDKLQDAADLREMGQDIDAEYLKDAMNGTPEYLSDIIVKVTEILLAKINVPLEEVERFTEQIKERRMGELLANFKGYDVQAVRREAREKGLEEGRQEGLEEGRKEERQEWIKKIMSLGQDHGSVEDIKRALLKGYSIEGN